VGVLEIMNHQTTLDMWDTPAFRKIGGGTWDGEPVTVHIDDGTGEVEMVYWGEWKF